MLVIFVILVVYYDGSKQARVGHVSYVSYLWWKQARMGHVNLSNVLRNVKLMVRRSLPFLVCN